MKRSSISIPFRRSAHRAVVSALIVAALAACGDRRRPASTSPTNQSVAPEPVVELPKPKPPSGGDWHLHLGNTAQNGESPDVTLKPPLELAWRYETSGAVSANPIVIDGTVYVGSSDRRFFALNASKWGERWRFLAKAPIIQSAAYANGVIVFADTKANLYGLNSETGKPLWNAVLDGWTVSPPVYAGGTVWVGVHPNRIVGFNPVTGAKTSEARGTATLGGVQYASDKGYFAPSSRFGEVANGNRNAIASVKAGAFAFRSSADGAIRAVDANGKSVWTARVDGGIAGPPAIARGFLYVPGANGALSAYSSRSPSRAASAPERAATVTVWESTARSEPRSSSTAVAVLNDRSRYALMETQSGWAGVLLPDGSRAWIAEGEWAVLPAKAVDGVLYPNETLARLSKGFRLPPGGERPVWSNDGESAAFMLRTQMTGQFWAAQEIGIWNAATGEARSVARGAFLNPNVSWSFDDKWIAFETYQHDTAFVWIVGATGDPMKRLAIGDAPQWSPVARRIAFRSRKETADELWRVDSDGENAVRLLNLPIKGYVGQFAYLMPPAWSPKGVSLALGADAKYYEDGRARLTTIGIAEKAQPTVIQTPAQKFREIAWSPDGLKVACVLAGHQGGSAADPLDQRVYVYWLDGSKPPFSVPHEHVAWVDTRAIAYVELSVVKGGRHRLWLHDIERRRRTLVLETTATISEVQWVPSRKALAVWTSAELIRDGKRQPTETRGWLVRLVTTGAS